MTTRLSQLFADRDPHQQQAYAEYQRVTQQAYAEYQRVTQSADAEYERVRQPAAAECQRVTQLADAEYERVRQPAAAEYERVTQSAYAEYERVTQLAAAEYERACALTFLRIEGEGDGPMTTRRDRRSADRDPHQQLSDAAERLDAAFECIAQLRAALLELAQAADAALQPNNDPQAMARLRMAIDAAWLDARH